jgi:hypothetical protein
LIFDYDIRCERPEIRARAASKVSTARNGFFGNTAVATGSDTESNEGKGKEICLDRCFRHAKRQMARQVVAEHQNPEITATAAAPLAQTRP